MIQEKTFTTLEYDKILSILKQHLASEVGLEYAEKFRPVTLLKEAETLQEQTWENRKHPYAQEERRFKEFSRCTKLVSRMHASLFLEA
ncbi:MAG: hypothetical protein R2881_10775 [Eubacteriales bacterium]